MVNSGLTALPSTALGGHGRKTRIKPRLSNSECDFGSASGRSGSSSHRWRQKADPCPGVSSPPAGESSPPKSRHAVRTRLMAGDAGASVLSRWVRRTDGPSPRSSPRRAQDAVAAQKRFWIARFGAAACRPAQATTSDARRRARRPAMRPASAAAAAIGAEQQAARRAPRADAPNGMSYIPRSACRRSGRHDATRAALS